MTMTMTMTSASTSTSTTTSTTTTTRVTALVLALLLFFIILLLPAHFTAAAATATADTNTEDAQHNAGDATSAASRKFSMEQMLDSFEAASQESEEMREVPGKLLPILKSAAVFLPMMGPDFEEGQPCRADVLEVVDEATKQGSEEPTWDNVKRYVCMMRPACVEKVAKAVAAAPIVKEQFKEKGAGLDSSILTGVVMLFYGSSCENGKVKTRTGAEMGDSQGEEL